MAAGGMQVRRWEPDPAAHPNGIVTRRSGRGAPFALVAALLLLAALWWVRDRTEQQRAEWRAGDPVLVTVTGTSGDRVLLSEFAGQRSWSADSRLAPSTEQGAQIQARLVGDCRCELRLGEPLVVPGWLLVAYVFVVGAAVRRLLQWRRWRRVDEVLRMPGRPVTLRPVWLRRSFGAPRWAVEVFEPVEGDGPAASEPVILELARTPAWWIDDCDHEVTLRGPERSSGVTILESAYGRVVPSSSPRRGAVARSRVCAWSIDLARALRMVPRPEAKLEIGGQERQRLSVGGAAGPGAGAGAERMLVLVAGARRLVAVSSVVVAVLIGSAVLVTRPGIGWLVPLSLLQPLAAASLRRAHAHRLSTKPPLSAWTDRRAAGEAARAAASLGFVSVAAFDPDLLPAHDPGVRP